MEDYVSYVLIAVGTVALSVRLLTTLGSGDVTCILIGVTTIDDTATNDTIIEDDDPTKDWGALGPYPPGGTIGMLNYAQTNKSCVRAVFTALGEYLPYWMLLQTLLLIVVEKFTFKIPKIGQKIERFYANIVKESLFGKDPDAAEDMTDPKTSTDVISRRRQRNEICVSLKQSSFIHRVYLLKNYFEIILIISVYLPTNIWFALNHEFNKSAQCNISIAELKGVVDVVGVSHFQCHGKKEEFFKLALYLHIILITMYGMCSLGSIIWCSYFRSFTKILRCFERKAKNDKAQEDIFKEGNGTSKGKDFLFLFDLLAHSCGIEMTLRVLTHSDDQFYEIFKPKLDKAIHVKLEEDKVKIEWLPSHAEKWLYQDGSPRFRRRILDIDSYEATIFPVEKIENTKRLPIKFKLQNDIKSKKPKLGAESNGDCINEETAYRYTNLWVFIYL